MRKGNGNENDSISDNGILDDGILDDGISDDVTGEDEDRGRMRMSEMWEE